MNTCEAVTKREEGVILGSGTEGVDSASQPLTDQIEGTYLMAEINSTHSPESGKLPEQSYSSTLKSILKELVGQTNGVYVPRSLITLTGDMAAGAMLAQVIYWSDRTQDPDGWFYKTAGDWEDEIGLTRRPLDRCTSLLKKFGLETKLKKANGAPTRHYRLNWEVFAPAFRACLDLSKTYKSGFVQNVQMDLSKTYKSLTENTTENTHKENTCEPVGSPAKTSPKKTEPSKEKTPRKPNPVFDAIALGSFGVTNANGKSGLVARIMQGSKDGKEDGVLDYYFGENWREQSNDDKLKGLADLMALAYRWHAGRKLSPPTSAIKIYNMIRSYKESDQYLIDTQPADEFWPGTQLYKREYNNNGDGTYSLKNRGG